MPSWATRELTSGAATGTRDIVSASIEIADRFGAFERNQHVGTNAAKNNTFQNIVAGLLSNPGVREWLQRSDVDWHPDFRDAVYRILTSMTNDAEAADDVAQSAED